MYKPNKRKIHSLLGYFSEKVKGTSISTVDMYSIFFHADLMHLNKYGRLITYDSYSLESAGHIIPRYINSLAEAQKHSHEFDNWETSISDLNTLNDSIKLYRHFAGFRQFVLSFNGLKDIVNTIEVGESTPITFRMMLYPGTREDAIEELEYMAKHASHNNIDFDTPKDIIQVD